MSDKNKLAAQILKAEMLGDEEKVRRLRNQLEGLANTPKPSSSRISEPPKVRSDHRKSALSQSKEVRKFINSNSSLTDMFANESKLTAKDELKMYLKTSSKFSREDFDTKNFSSEIDDSQVILSKSKKQKTGCDLPSDTQSNSISSCNSCLANVAKHLLIECNEQVYLSLMNEKPFLSSMSNIVLRNAIHGESDNFVTATDKQQCQVNNFINDLTEMWLAKGYRCIIMETYLRNNKQASGGFTSGFGHFRVHCLPVKDKHFERARMYFKQAIQESECDWSLNRKLLKTDGRKIQRYLPKGLSYFWVCFDKLDNGFGHVIENEQKFSRYFGLEVLSGLLDKDFNTMNLNQRESFNEQFERCKDFKLMYGRFKESCD